MEPRKKKQEASTQLINVQRKKKKELGLFKDVFGGDSNVKERKMQ